MDEVFLRKVRSENWRKGVECGNQLVLLEILKILEKIDDKLNE